ncbi:MAG: biosynthetic-type acetolactate synthase large subunit [Victivallaceae bacterium]|nr:biosynthetic-type acetolactate synthase large subunit [Victivallaceae bacterium]
MHQPEIVKLRGNVIVARMLEKLGVKTLFAYPGGFSIELHQALRESSIRVVLPRHEQGGAFEADGFARASGQVAACMATSGPGATNLLTGVADCYMDSIPVVFITGQVPADLIGKNVFQETDIIGMTRPVVKHSYLVLDATDLPRVLREAFYLAGSGRPGPVLVDIPKNVQQQTAKVDLNAPMDLPGYHLPPAPSDEAVETIREMIAKSRKPCVYAGGGVVCSGSSEQLRKFAESYNLPVVTTLMGLGALPHDHELNLHWLGMHGNGCANFTANECDLLLAFGARFDDRVTGNPKSFAVSAKIVHVDIDDSEINKNKPADFSLVADIGQVLEKLNAKPEFNARSEWFAEIELWKKEFPLTYRKKPEHVQPQFVMETLCRHTKGQAVIVPGVGQHQMWSAQYYQYNFPRQFLTSGGLGSMGFGLPAAIGAKLACPDKTVINIDGDGSFQMNIQELGTAFVEQVPVKMIIMNNQHLGMVAQWEDRFYEHRRGNTVLGRCKGSSGVPNHNCENCDGTFCSGEGPYPDFVAIAAGYGIAGRHVFTVDELDDAIKAMLDAPGPYLLDVHIGYNEHVLPMIPAGKDYHSIIME